MKVLLVKPPEPKKSDNTITGRIIEHLGLGYIASVVRENGFEAEILDSRIKKLEMEHLKAEILNNEFDILGISIPYQWSIPEVLELIGELRRNGLQKKIFVGGHPATFSYKELLDEQYGIDYVCVGEGEYTVLELMQIMDKQGDIESIRGIAFRKEGQIMFTGYRELIPNLDELPFPARDPVEEMLNNWPFMSISICGSRGCSWASCTFCDVQSFYKLCSGKNWRGRSVENILDEIEMLLKKYRHNKFSFIDDDFFGPKKFRKDRIFALCDGIEKRNLNIQFSLLCNVRDIEKDAITRMKEVGLFGIFLGVESGVQRVLNTFCKGVTIEENREAILKTREFGLSPACGSIFIDPYTTIDEIKENIEFWEDVGLMSIEKYKELIVFKGTPLLEELQRNNKVYEKDFDYLYEHVLDTDVSKLNKIVYKFNNYCLKELLERPRIIETRIMKIMKLNGMQFKDIEDVLNKSKDIHEKVCSDTFTYFLKKAIENLALINESNIDMMIEEMLSEKLEEYKKMCAELESTFKQFLLDSNIKMGEFIGRRRANFPGYTDNTNN